jgi:hypothetical protein
MTPTIDDIIKTLKAKDYTVYTSPYKLNIVGLRSVGTTNQNTFDDYIAFFYYDDKGNIMGKVAPATTDPSVYYLKDPMMPDVGTAILKSGEYLDAYQIGLHKGQYEALVQVKPVTVVRDNDRNAEINYFAPTMSGLYGINIHRASRGKNNPTQIDKDSAGCQVFRDESDYQLFMNFAKKSREVNGNKFTYILIDNRDIRKLRNTSLLGLALVGTALYLYSKSK